MIERRVTVAPRWRREAGAWLPDALALAVPILLVAAWWWPLPGPSGAYALGGRLPWSDGFDYWSAAQHLLQQGVLDEWGSRRPINGAFLAARLALTGDRLLLALAIQSMLLAASLAAVTAQAIARFGVLSGAVLGLALLVPIAVVQCTTQSEGLGLLLANMSLALLLRATASPRPRRGVALGLALLTVAMAARPGALFMLPALGVGAVVHAWRGRRRDGAAMAATVVAAVLLGVGAGAAAGSLYADPAARRSANFAGTLLGLARGTDYYDADAWLRSQVDRWAGESERADLAYREAWRLMREQPTVMAQSLVRNTAKFALRAWPLLLLAALAIPRAPRRERWFWISGWLGILLSVPVVFGDGGVRCLAASWPFMLAGAASILRRRRAPEPSGGTEPSTARRWLTAGTVAALAAPAMAIVVPVVARPAGLLHRLPRHGSFEADQYPMPGTEWVDWVRGAPAFHALVVATEAQREALPSALRALRAVTPEALAADPAAQEFGEPLAGIPSPYLLCVAYDLGQRRARHLALPADEKTAAALAAGSWAVRIDTVPLAPGSRVSVGKFVAPVPGPPPR